MSDQAPPPPPPPPPAPPTAPPPPYGAPVYANPAHVGKVRSTGVCILLFVVTLGFYGWYWFYQVHEDLKRHTGKGIGGGIALVLIIVGAFVGVTGLIVPFLTSHETGEVQQRAGRSKTVSALTGLWVFPGLLLVFLPIVWFVKTNGALNEYWRSRGAPG